MLVSTGAFVSFVSVSDIGDNVFSFFLSRSYAAIVVRGVDGAPFLGWGKVCVLKTLIGDFGAQNSFCGYHTLVFG